MKPRKMMYVGEARDANDANLEAGGSAAKELLP